ncbi:PAS domain S-box protein [Noviherbaspirillum sp.]|uniref:PAS domain S-box protein n=1 Tax=Noviherbaspirillum sp. TaxID=1926288 RepID=UPI002B49A3B5|nr:PAS domain S-box protein [Noviherbaspirillum sp.]HJV80387.1 PAS domain S-box protein [Noviherbaspirillum sp.]
MLEQHRPTDQTAQATAGPLPKSAEIAEIEERFNRITRLTQRAFNAPIAFVLLDEAGQRRFQSCQGLAADDLPYCLPFCESASSDGGPGVIDDAVADPRFATNPLVTGPTQVRFYAGWALQDRAGKRIGTLGLFDRAPRRLNAGDVDALRDLAQWAESEMNNRALLRALTVAEESESRLHAVVDSVADGIITLDQFGKIVSINPAAVRIFGYQPEEVIGQNIKVLMPTDYHHAHDGYLRNFRDTGRTRIIGQDREVTGRRKDGSLFAMELTVNEMWLGGRRGFAGIIRDITVRRDNERKLRESSALLQTVMSSTSSFVYGRDMHGRFLFANKEYKKVFGFAPGQLVGKSVEDVYPPELARYNREKDQAVLQGGPGTRLEDEIQVNGDGPIFLVVRSPLINEKGEVYGVCGVGTDISQRKAAEEAMSALNRQLAETTGLQQAILNSANFSIIATDLHGTIRLFNIGAQRMLGYEPDELIGKSTPDVFHDPEEIVARAHLLSIETGRHVAPGFEALVARTRRGLADEHEWTYIRKDGSHLPVMLSVTAVRDEHQRITGFLGIAYDLTERKRAEHIKDEFISTVSHELRTPLTSIRGSLGLLTGGVAGDIPERARHLLQIANNNCERLVRLINDILDVEKIESGNMRFEIVPQPILPLIEQALDAMQDYAAQYQVSFELQVQAADVRVAVDADRMVQVMINLLSNAAKFSPQGSHVQVRLTRLPNCMRLSVIDQGPGIVGEFRERIFQKFAQADSSDSRQKGGTGLGLSISRAIVERHHGRIDFDGVPGGGTEFFVELPLIAGDGEHSAMRAGHGRILICEDDPDVAQLLGMMLAQAGLRSDIAYDAAQARRLLAEGSYEAMTLDLALPGEDGVALLRWMRQHESTRHLPVVVVSARAEEGRRRLTGGAIGIVDWIPKPIDQARLIAALQSVMHNCRSDAPAVLHVEDDHDLVKVVTALLHPDVAVRHARTLADARDHLAAECFKAILLDLQLPDGHGSELLGTLPPLNAATPVVVFAAEDVDQPTIDNVHAALVKSRTPNEQLLAILHELIRQSRGE